MTVIKMPAPRNDTPELRASLFKASVTAVRDKMAEHGRINVKTWVYIGNEIKGMADLEGKSIYKMFAKNIREQGNPSLYPFSRRTGEIFVEIAKKFGAASAARDSERLPVSWYALYILTKLSDESIQEFIDSGSIHPLMSRTEAMKLVNKPKKISKTSHTTLEEVKGILAKLDRADANRLLELLRKPKILSDLRKLLNG